MPETAVALAPSVDQSGGNSILLPTTMAAVLLTGHGGLERLEYRTDVALPRPRRGEVLVQVAAAGINNTDVNTRIGWYSKAITAKTGDGGTAGFDAVDDVDATWSGMAMKFPRIQGADVCGRIVDVGEEVTRNRIGERVLVRNMLRTPVDYRPYEWYIERGEVLPVVSRTYPLHEITRAQEDFLRKAHTGKLVLVPPALSA
jgi:NADPH:quinone reductase-like Zn-dependent oxidoreductase